MKFEHNALIGRDEAQLVEFLGGLVHCSALNALRQFECDVTQAGFALGLVSAYRSFERQLSIWNSKAQGLRPILDSDGATLARTDLSDEEAMFAILRWSALPGASRHHWGTDFDVVDVSAIPVGYQVQLTEQETNSGGIFGEFHAWLHNYLLASDLGFFKPYGLDTGGVAREPWHLSYGPVARGYQASLSKGMLLKLIEATDIELKNSILRHFDEIYSRFIWVDWSLYPEVSDLT